MKSEELTRRQFSDNYQSEFSRRYACWARNHKGWSRMKKRNRKLFKKKFRREGEKEIENELGAYVGQRAELNLYSDMEGEELA